MTEDQMPENEIIDIKRKVIERLKEADIELSKMREKNRHLVSWELPDVNDLNPVIRVLFDRSSKPILPSRIVSFKVEIVIIDDSQPHLNLIRGNRPAYDPDHPLFFGSKLRPKPPTECRIHKARQSRKMGWSDIFRRKLYPFIGTAIVPNGS